jgi:hypothetical protein
MMTNTGRLIVSTMVLIAIALGAWELAYHGPNEPKDLRYQCWRLGLPVYNPDKALCTMIGDRKRDALVIGKTQSELTQQFGELTTLEQASPYIQTCYLNSQYRGSKVLFLRHSNWQVLMRDKRAAGLVLVKGC